MKAFFRLGLVLHVARPPLGVKICLIMKPFFKLSHGSLIIYSNRLHIIQDRYLIYFDLLGFRRLAGESVNIICQSSMFSSTV